MITVNIRTSLVLKDIFGQWKFKMPLPENSTFKDLLNIFARVHGDRILPYIYEPDKKTVASHIMFMINGRNIRFLNKENTILQEGDEVTILLPAGGG